MQLDCNNITSGNMMCLVHPLCFVGGGATYNFLRVSRQTNRKDGKVKVFPSDLSVQLERSSHKYLVRLSPLESQNLRNVNKHSATERGFQSSSGFSLLTDHGLHPSQVVMVGFLCGNTAVDNIGFVDIVGNNMTSGIVLMIIRIGGGDQLDGQG